MPDLIDGVSGELRSIGAQEAVENMLAVPDGVYGAPIGPSEIDSMVDEITELLLHVGRVVALLYEDVHRAEEKYQAAFSGLMTMHAKHGAQLARQFAIAKSATEQHELNLAKEKLRYATEMQSAIQNRSYGLMNIGKRMQPAFSAGGVGRP